MEQTGIFTIYMKKTEHMGVFCDCVNFFLAFYKLFMG